MPGNGLFVCLFQKKNLEFQKPKSFVMGNKPAWVLSPRERLSLFYWTVNKLDFSPEGDTIPTLQVCSLLKTSPKTQFETKVVTVSAHPEI